MTGREALADVLAAEILIDSRLTGVERRRALQALSRQVERELGGPTDEPCTRCGNLTYERNDGDLLCDNCGLPYGEDDDD